MEVVSKWLDLCLSLTCFRFGDEAPAPTPRRKTEKKRRRALASENTEVLASVRWHSAFDALRLPERKTEEPSQNA